MEAGGGASSASGISASGSRACSQAGTQAGSGGGWADPLCTGQGAQPAELAAAGPIPMPAAGTHSGQWAHFNDLPGFINENVGEGAGAARKHALPEQRCRGSRVSTR